MERNNGAYDQAFLELLKSWGITPNDILEKGIGEALNIPEDVLILTPKDNWEGSPSDARSTLRQRHSH